MEGQRVETDKKAKEALAPRRNESRGLSPGTSSKLVSYEDTADTTPRVQVIRFRYAQVD